MPSVRKRTPPPLPYCFYLVQLCQRASTDGNDTTPGGRIFDGSWKERIFPSLQNTIFCAEVNAADKTQYTTTDKPWFTDECKNLYNAYQQALGTFNKYRSNENRLSLNLAKQKYKWLENKLKRQYKNQREINIKPRYTPQDLPGENTGTVFDELDSPFTEKELDDGIKKLKRDKSTGYDNMMNEYIIMSKNFIKPVLCKIFNCILTNGDFPELWVKSIIIPVFKKGDFNQPGNFRGISLVSHIGKLFTTLINARLTKWSRNHDVLTDAQFGFRPGYGTTDAIFALNSLISKSLRSGKRFYCCFVDYKTAFDSVTHMKLWLRLIRLGVT
ncbi:Hypothetical predicted protein, partial [Mytilus galloprovincialis]